MNKRGFIVFYFEPVNFQRKKKGKNCFLMRKNFFPTKNSQQKFFIRISSKNFSIEKNSVLLKKI